MLAPNTINAINLSDNIALQDRVLAPLGAVVVKSIGLKVLVALARVLVKVLGGD